jgi:hypothetical protein
VVLESRFDSCRTGRRACSDRISAHCSKRISDYSKPVQRVLAAADPLRMPGIFIGGIDKPAAWTSHSMRFTIVRIATSVLTSLARRPKFRAAGSHDLKR